MAIQVIEKYGLKFLVSRNSRSKRIAYILYPMDVPVDWIKGASEKYGMSIVVVTGMDWDNDLTPWPAPGVPAGEADFKGEAGKFLLRLEGDVHEMESRLGLTVGEGARTLTGVSLSGLFTLWQWPQCQLFDNIISLSGSFWYEGFMQWIATQDFTTKKGVAYFLLGDLEAKSRIKAFTSVEVNTEAVVRELKSQGVNVIFDMVPGNHYQYGLQRLDKALTALAGALKGR